MPGFLEHGAAMEAGDPSRSVPTSKEESRIHWSNPMLSEASSSSGAQSRSFPNVPSSISLSSSSLSSNRPTEGRERGGVSRVESTAPAGSRVGAGVPGEGSDASLFTETGTRKDKKDLPCMSQFSCREAGECREISTADRIPCPVDPRHSIYLSRVSAHVRKCTKIRDMAYAHLLPFVLPGCNCGEQIQENAQCESRQQADAQLGTPSSSPPPPGEKVPFCSPACASSSSLLPFDIDELHQKVFQAVKQCCEEVSLPLSVILPPSPEEAEEASNEMGKEGERNGCNPAAELLRAAAGSEDLPLPEVEQAKETGRDGSLGSAARDRTHADSDTEEEKRASILVDCIARASKAAAQHRQRQRQGPAGDQADSQGEASSPAGVFPLAASASSLQSLGMSPLEWLRKVVTFMDKHDVQNAQLVALCALAGFLPTSQEALKGLVVVELGAGKAALTRWLATWTASAFADTARTRFVGTKKDQGCNSGKECQIEARHSPEAECTATGEDMSPKVNLDVSLQPKEPGSETNVVGVRFVVVEREARRNAKELKDEQMQSMSSTRIRSENHFKKRKQDHATDRVLASEGERHGNEAFGHQAPRFVRHVIRLRIDISDFDLGAMLRYMNLGDAHALRQPHVPSFFKLLRQHNCRLFPRRPSPLRQTTASDSSWPEDEATQTNGCNNRCEQISRNRNTDSSKSNEMVPEVGPEKRRALEKPETASPTEQAATLANYPHDNDASLDAYWELTKQLGSKGGADIKETELCLKSHFLNKPAQRVLGVAKHLCGGGTDVALRCFVRCRRAFFTRDSGMQREDAGASGSKSTGVSSEVSLCLCIAPCCHHRCDEQSFVGLEVLRRLGFADNEFARLAAATGWATGACGVKQRTGSLIKRLFDLCRLIWLREEGFQSATIRKFASSSCSPENFVILASATT
ncbi:methyltransferase TRM13 [Toxoplasma gondii CAST]|uniref:tRNA:m(4)X modification enzyme TRM13 n=1 Tax=Toxoplasma gondii CAST TaxID=943122 RepID=A0A425HNR8_TOXGO|nr:methyltransferase TRM13 [Toxoplasma gondii CAST]